MVMEINTDKYENFVFYGSMKQTIDALPTDMGNALLRAIMNYGTTGEIDDSDSIIHAIMLSIIPNIDSAKKRFKTSQENGSRGGRKKRINDNEILELHSSGLNQREISEELDISLKSVQRALLGQKTKPRHNLNIDIEKDIETQTQKENESEPKREPDMPF